jgi:hypothetical protein
MKPLVGDEIQCRRINRKIGGDRVDGTITLVTCLMDLHLGASSHMLQLWVTLQGARVSLTNICSGYNKEFLLHRHLVYKP